MPQQVDQVVANERVAPQLVLKPEGAVQQWVVLLCCSRFEPDAVQTVKRLQSGLGNVRIIVPKSAAVEGRQIGKERQQQNERQTDAMRSRCPTKIREGRQNSYEFRPV